MGTPVRGKLSRADVAPCTLTNDGVHLLTLAGEEEDQAPAPLTRTTPLCVPIRM